MSTVEFIPIKLHMHTRPSASCMTAEALEASVSLGVGGPVSLNRDNLNGLCLGCRMLYPILAKGSAVLVPGF
jgi:hypothetical protein